MAISSRLLKLSLLGLAINYINAQQITCPSGSASSGASCISGNGNDFASRYCSSVLSITTPTSTTTETFIKYD